MLLAMVCRTLYMQILGYLRNRIHELIRVPFSPSRIARRETNDQSSIYSTMVYAVCDCFFTIVTMAKHVRGSHGDTELQDPTSESANVRASRVFHRKVLLRTVVGIPTQQPRPPPLYSPVYPHCIGSETALSRSLYLFWHRLEPRRAHLEPTRPSLARHAGLQIVSRL